MFKNKQNYKQIKKMGFMRLERLEFMILWVVTLDLLLFCIADPKVHYYDFVLQEANFTRLCSRKKILTVNGSFPGPTIQARRGDTVYVNVHNQGTYGVTLHWHGVKQPRNPWSDGPENITQCPIQPGNNFTYHIILSDEEGTVWWHAHSDWTRATVHGALVILPPVGSSYPFPTPHAQHTIILGSWYKRDVMAVINEALSTGAAPQVSDAHTINGQPGDLQPCSNSTFKLVVEQGKTYLLRIIGAVLNEEQFFGIANHKLRVVGHDGGYIKPITTDYIMITPGQTYDVLVTANQIPSLYYMAASPFFDGAVAFDNSTATAIFQYNGNYSTPTSIPFPNLPAITDGNAANNFTNQLRSVALIYKPINVPKKINQHLYVTVSTNQNPCPANQTCLGPNGNSLSASLNNVSFVTPAIDILDAYYRSLNGVFEKDFPSDPPNLFNFTGDNTNLSKAASPGTKVKVLNYMDEVEMVFQGTSVGASENHPMHIHGYSFYVVGSGSGNYNKDTDPNSYNLIDPPKVNTIGVPKNGWVAIRFFADNPGVWFIHCHLERHASWGMATVLLVKNGKTKATTLLPPPPHMPPCSS